MSCLNTSTSWELAIIDLISCPVFLHRSEPPAMRLRRGSQDLRNPMEHPVWDQCSSLLLRRPAGSDSVGGGRHGRHWASGTARQPALHGRRTRRGIETVGTRQAAAAPDDLFTPFGSAAHALFGRERTSRQARGTVSAVPIALSFLAPAPRQPAWEHDATRRNGGIKLDPRRRYRPNPKLKTPSGRNRANPGAQRGTALPDLRAACDRLRTPPFCSG